MARIVSLINMKGGVGKTTLAVNLACYFFEHRRKTLVVDLDPQFNASQCLLGVREYTQLLAAKKPTIRDVFEQPTIDARDVVYKRPFRDGPDLIPSQLELALSVKSPDRKEHHLTRIVKELDKEYDLIIIDCAPTESVLTTAAYLSSEWLLVPVKPDYLSTIGLPLLARSMQDFTEKYEGQELKLAGVVFNAASNYVPEEALAKTQVHQIAQKHGWYVFKNQVKHSRSYATAARHGVSIHMAPYARWNTMENFRLFAQEFAKRISL